MIILSISATFLNIKYSEGSDSNNTIPMGSTLVSKTRLSLLLALKVLPSSLFLEMSCVVLFAVMFNCLVKE